MSTRSASALTLLGGCLAVATGLLAAIPAQAQSQPAPADGATLDELVVTAQRREERLQDVPASISAFGGEQLNRAGVTSTRELTTLTPGLNFTMSSYSPQPTVRGIGTRGVSAGDESVVPIFVDGVYQPFIFGSIFDLNGIERVEVLRGPQSALYGRNATGGAINIITRAPSVEPSAEIGLRYGSFDERDISGYVTGGTGPIATDLSVRFRKDDGYVKNILLGINAAQVESLNVRSKTQFKPSDRFDATLTLNYSNVSDATPYAAQPFNGNTLARRINPNVFIATGYREIASNYDAKIGTLVSSGAVTANYHADAFDLTSITGVTYAKVKLIGDIDYTPLDTAQTISSQKTQSLYQEVYAASKGDGPISWIVGGVYFADLSKAAPQGGISTSVTAGATFGQATKNAVVSSIDTSSWAGYAQVGWEFAESWSLTVGGRYTREHKEFETASYAINLATRAVTIVPPAQREKTWSEFTPSATLSWQPTPQVNLFAKAGKGFKSGIFNSASTNTTPVNPENVTQYEVGAKTTLRPWLLANVSAYYTKLKDLQANARDPVTSQAFLQNAASAEIYGVEAEVQARPTSQLGLHANFSALHGTYESFPGAVVTIPQTAVNPVPATACVLGTGALLGGNRSVVCDVSGNDIIRTPFMTVSVGGDYKIPLADGELVLAANWFHAGHSFWDPLNRLREPAYDDVTAQAVWTAPDGRWEVGVWGKNLTNEHRAYSVVTSPTTDNRNFVRPRSVGVSFKARM